MKLLSLKDVKDIKVMMDNLYKFAKEIKKIDDYAVISNMQYLDDMIETYKKQIDAANEILDEFKSAFIVPVPRVVEKINEALQKVHPKFKVEYEISDEDYNPGKFTYSIYLFENDFEIGTLLTRSYYFEDFKEIGGYNKEVDKYIKTNNSRINCADISPLLRSEKMLKTFKDPKILNVIDTPTVQNALWEVVVENVKYLTQEEIESKNTSIQIAEQKFNSAKEDLERLQKDKQTLENNLKDSEGLDL